MGILIILGVVVLAVIFGVAWGMQERRSARVVYRSGQGLDALGTYIVADSAGDVLSDLFDD